LGQRVSKEADFYVDFKNVHIFCVKKFPKIFSENNVFLQNLQKCLKNLFFCTQTKANGNSWSTKEGVFPWLVRLARRAGTREFCLALAALVSPVQNIFPTPRTFSLYLSPSPINLTRQSCRVAYLLICVSVCISEYSNYKRGPCCFPPSSLCLPE
jgi:hypothetical protein